MHVFLKSVLRHKDEPVNTTWEAGYSYDESSVVSKATLGVAIFIGIISSFTFIGIAHCKTGILPYSSIRAFHQHDDFDFKSILGFCFQIWDFGSDCLLCYSIYDHWYQLSTFGSTNDDMDDSRNLLYFFISSATFTFFPWFANMIFLRFQVRQWQLEAQKILLKERMNKKRELDGARRRAKEKRGRKKKSLPDVDEHDQDRFRLTAADQSFKATAFWLSGHAAILIFLCFISGGAPAALKVANSKLFGMDLFDMGLSNYNTDRTSGHRLWLTVAFANIPQIIISVLYGQLFVGFNGTVMIAFISSLASLILSIFQALISYPKHYYSYEVVIVLDNTHGQKQKALKFSDQLRFTKAFAEAVQIGIQDNTKTCTISKVFKYNIGNMSLVFDAVFDTQLPMPEDDGAMNAVYTEICQNIMLAIDSELKIKFKLIDVNYAVMQWRYMGYRMLQLRSVECIKSVLGCGKPSRQSTKSESDGIHDEVTADNSLYKVTEITYIRGKRNTDSNTEIELELLRNLQDLRASGGFTGSYGPAPYASNFTSNSGFGLYARPGESLLRTSAGQQPSGSEFDYLQQIMKQRKNNRFSTKEITQFSIEQGTGSWKDWTTKDIQTWLHRVLVERFDDTDSEILQDIETFMQRFVSLRVTVETIIKLQDDVEYFNNFQKEFEPENRNTNWDIALWPIFKSAISQLEIQTENNTFNVAQDKSFNREKYAKYLRDTHNVKTVGNEIDIDNIRNTMMDDQDQDLRPKIDDSKYFGQIWKQRQHSNYSTKTLTQFAIEQGAGSWEDWTRKDISIWMYKILMERFDENNDKNVIQDIELFINQCNKLKINVETIKKLMKNENFFIQFKNEFDEKNLNSRQTDWDFTLWPIFESAMKQLGDTPGIDAVAAKAKPWNVKNLTSKIGAISSNLKNRARSVLQSNEYDSPNNDSDDVPLLGNESDEKHETMDTQLQKNRNSKETFGGGSENNVYDSKDNHFDEYYDGEDGHEDSNVHVDSHNGDRDKASLKSTSDNLILKQMSVELVYKDTNETRVEESTFVD